MGFYEQISRYYDFIFPVGDEQLEFITKTVGESPKKILDVACGSGGYSEALANRGYIVTGVDIDSKMVEMASRKAFEGLCSFNVFECDMLSIKEKVPLEDFDAVFCIGNSIVHLNGLKNIGEALEQMYACLKKDGHLILQIINYDRILAERITSLPAISNEKEGLVFIRNYSYEPERNLVHFNTNLNVNKSEAYENSVALVPLQSVDLFALMQQAGFSDIKFFGDFMWSDYNKDSYMLVAKAVK